jgi:uncharacterized membrane protein
LAGPGVIFAFLVSYLLAGVSFAIAYAGAAGFGSDVVSTFGLGQPVPIRSFWDYLYFSVVTGTTLGYGDFRPCPVHARVLVQLQVVESWAFLAVGVVIVNNICRGPRTIGDGKLTWGHLEQ